MAFFSNKKNKKNKTNKWPLPILYLLITYLTIKLCPFSELNPLNELAFTCFDDLKIQQSKYTIQLFQKKKKYTIQSNIFFYFLVKQSNILNTCRNYFSIYMISNGRLFSINALYIWYDIKKKQWCKHIIFFMLGTTPSIYNPYMMFWDVTKLLSNPNLHAQIVIITQSIIMFHAFKNWVGIKIIPKIKLLELRICILGNGNSPNCNMLLNTRRKKKE